jgi:hypothetical protein
MESCHRPPRYLVVATSRDHYVGGSGFGTQDLDDPVRYHHFIGGGITSGESWKDSDSPVVFVVLVVQSFMLQAAAWPDRAEDPEADVIVLL